MVRLTSNRGWNRRPRRHTPVKPSELSLNLEGRLSSQERQAVQDAFVQEHIVDTPYATQFNGITASKGRIQVRYSSDPKGHSFENLPSTYQHGDDNYKVDYLQAGRVKALDFNTPDSEE